MALYSLYCAEVPLRNCSLTHSLVHQKWKPNALLRYACSLDNKLMNCLKSATLLRVRNSNTVAAAAAAAAAVCKQGGSL